MESFSISACYFLLPSMTIAQLGQNILEIGKNSCRCANVTVSSYICYNDRLNIQGGSTILL